MSRAIIFFLAWPILIFKSSAALIYLNVDSNGTGANTNIYGTTWDSANQTVTGWGSNFRDYQFQLQTPSSVTLNNFYLQVSASLRQQTPINGSGVIGAAWFSGAITANPTYSSAIATATMDAALLPIDRTAFDTLLMGAGTFSPSQSITSSSSTYFIRVWANGNNSNQGVQLKLVPNSDLTYNAASYSTTMSNWNGSGYIPAGTFTPVTPPGPSPVPEPGQAAASLLLLSAIGGYVFLKRRKNAKPAPAA